MKRSDWLNGAPREIVDWVSVHAHNVTQQINQYGFVLIQRTSTDDDLIPPGYVAFWSGGMVPNGWRVMTEHFDRFPPL
jgi:hypothetical protein